LSESNKPNVKVEMTVSPLAVIIFIICSIGLMFLTAYIFTLYWSWFIIPIFGIINITYKQAIAISFFSKLIIPFQIREIKEDGVLLGLCSTKLILLLGIWALGSILHSIGG
jgi:hypothetical protein